MAIANLSGAGMFFGAGGASAFANPVYGSPVDIDITEPLDVFILQTASAPAVSLVPVRSEDADQRGMNMFGPGKKWPPNFLRSLRDRLYNRFIRYKYGSLPEPIPFKTILAQHVRNKANYLSPLSIGGMPARNVRPHQLNPILLDSAGNFRVFAKFDDVITALEEKYGKPWKFDPNPSYEHMKYGWGGEYPQAETPTVASRDEVFYGPIYHAKDCVASVSVDDKGCYVVIRSEKDFTESGIPVPQLEAEYMRSGFRPMGSEFPVVFKFRSDGNLKTVKVVKYAYYWGFLAGQAFSTFNSKISVDRKVVFEASAD